MRNLASLAWLCAVGTAGAGVACGDDDGGGSGAGPGVGGAAGTGTSGAGGSVAGSASGGVGASGGDAASGGVGASAGVGASGGEPGDGGPDASPDAPDHSGELLVALGQSVWHGAQTRDGKLRAFELEFDAPGRLWAELRNPFGPARLREMRGFTVDPDGVTVTSVVTSPAGWPVHPENGRKDDWTLEVIDGAPRKLRTTRGGIVEEFDEGPWPAPEGGLTAFVRVFPSSGPVFDAMCAAGVFGSIDYPTLWSFARGTSGEPELGYDYAAGVRLDTWTDPSGNNQFAVGNIPGFDRDGGTELSDQFNFIAHYVGTLTHPGGSLAMRERDDMVQDAMWGFIGPGVGSANTNDLFLEVHDLAWADLTANEPSAFFAGGDLPIEVMIVRCVTALQDVDVEVSLGGGAWTLVGSAATKPEIDPGVFLPMF